MNYVPMGRGDCGDNPQQGLLDAGERKQFCDADSAHLNARQKGFRDQNTDDPCLLLENIWKWIPRRIPLATLPFVQSMKIEALHGPELVTRKDVVDKWADTDSACSLAWLAMPKVKLGGAKLAWGYVYMIITWSCLFLCIYAYMHTILYCLMVYAIYMIYVFHICSYIYIYT